MKFNNYELKKDNHGYEFAKEGIMKGSNKKPCTQCGEPTNFIEICSEGHFCSDECVNEWYEKYVGALRVD